MRYRIRHRLHLGRLRWCVEGRRWFFGAWQVVDWQASGQADALNRLHVYQGRQLPADAQPGQLPEL